MQHGHARTASVRENCAHARLLGWGGALLVLNRILRCDYVRSACVAGIARGWPWPSRGEGFNISNHKQKHNHMSIQSILLRLRILATESTRIESHAQRVPRSLRGLQRPQRPTSRLIIYAGSSGCMLPKVGNSSESVYSCTCIASDGPCSQFRLHTFQSSEFSQSVYSCGSVLRSTAFELHSCTCTQSVGATARPLHVGRASLLCCNM